MKLNKGDRIEIIGFVMLRGMKDGEQYEVTFTENPDFGSPVYCFKRVLKSGNGLSKRSRAFFAHSVDPMINPNLENRIEIIQKIGEDL